GMHRIFEGVIPSRRSRTTRCARTCVLPEPALAATQAETAGSEVSVCTCKRSAGMARRLVMASALPAGGRRTVVSPCSFLAGLFFAANRPFLHAREVIVGAVSVLPH